MRFREVLWNMGWCLPLSGIIRREALLRTSLYGNYSGADKVLLAELALQGRFHEVQQQLFAKRMHLGCTHDMTFSQRAANECRDFGGIPQVRMLRDYARMTLTSEIGPVQRLHCMITIGGMALHGDVWQRLLLAGRQKYKAISFDARQIE